MEIITQLKKTKNKKATKANISVMSVLLGQLPKQSPVVQNSGKNIVSDRTVSRLNDYLQGDKKDEV